MSAPRNSCGSWRSSTRKTPAPRSGAKSGKANPSPGGTEEHGGKAEFFEIFQHFSLGGALLRDLPQCFSVSPVVLLLFYRSQPSLLRANRSGNRPPDFSPSWT